MKKIVKEFKEFRDDMYEIANIIQDDSGLPTIIYISPKNANHGPRIKVQKNYSDNIQNNFFSVTISDNPSVIGKDTGDIKDKDIQLIKKWIIKNKQILLDYSNGTEKSTKTVLNKLQKI